MKSLKKALVDDDVDLLAHDAHAREGLHPCALLPAAMNRL